MSRMRYRVATRPRPGTKDDFGKWTKRQKLAAALQTVRAEAAKDGGPYACRFEEGKHRWAATADLDTAIEKLRGRASSKAFKVGERLFIRTSKRVIALQEVWPSVRLPRGAKNAPAEWKRRYRYVMWRKGWEWWGGTVCRANRRDTSRYSEHSWEWNADDFAPPNKKQGDKIAPKLEEKFGGESVWWTEMHYDHIHYQDKTHRRGSIPPCAK